MNEQNAEGGTVRVQHLVGPADWTKDRREELSELRTLLFEVQSINSGSHCLERIKKCMEIAERLTRSDLDKPRESFLNFLISHIRPNVRLSEPCKVSKDETL